jgi:hypothetical protein
MSKTHPARPSGRVPTPPARGRSIILLALAVVVVLGFWWWKATPVKPSATPPSSAVEIKTPPGAAAVGETEFQKLKGKWLRPDGGYIVEIRSVDGSGKMDAAYFNPKPIHVARAEASREGTVTKVFVELRDVNYPGSTYALTYDAERDQLKGIYYQAAMQQQFEVFFVRTP